MSLWVGTGICGVELRKRKFNLDLLTALVLYFLYRHKCLVDRLLSQGYKALRLEKSFKKFYGRYQDLIEKYRRSVNAMVSDSFPGQFLFNM